jgi:hypothetical protein
MAKQNQLIESYKERAAKMEIDLREQTKAKANMEKIYSKEIEDIRSLLNKKEGQLIEQIHKLGDELQQTINMNEHQNDTFSDYI